MNHVVIQLGVGTGGGACPGDRCCPKPPWRSTDSRKGTGMFGALKPKKEK